MTDITIMSHVANACTSHFTDPMLAIGWVRTIAGEWTPELFMSLFKALNPGNVDAAVNARHLVDYCLGAGV